MTIINFPAIWEFFLELLPYIPVTLVLSLLASALGAVLGLLFAVVKIARVPVLFQIVSVLVSFLRGTPTLIQLLLAYNLVPIIIIALNQQFYLDLSVVMFPAFATAVLTFAFHQSAYDSEYFRAAFLAVDKGEIAAGESLGMTSRQVLFRIIIPNALVIALPSIGNSFIGMLKQSSLAFTVAVVELTAFAEILGARDFNFFEAYLAAAIIYWGLTCF